jgi:hypothetical protein
MGYSIRSVFINEKDEVLRISLASVSQLFDGTLALPQYAGKRIRWCEVHVLIDTGRAIAVQRLLPRYLNFNANGFLDKDRQMDEARLRMDAHFGDITMETLSPEECLARDAETWLAKQVITQECEWEPDHDLRLVIQNVALDPKPRLWVKSIS